MIRRAVLPAAVLLVLSTSSVLGATKTVTIYATSYSPAGTKIAMGGYIQWTNTTSKARSVVSDASFLATSFFKTTAVAAHSTSAPLLFPQAGTFPYHDSTNGMHGKIKVPMRVDMPFISVGSSVILTLGTLSASTGGQPDYHIVQASKDGGAWVQIATTQSTATTWKPTAAGKWIVRTCMHHALSGANSGWSPTVTVTVS